MNYQKLSTFRFFDTLDANIMRPKFSGSRRTSLYPSEASVICTDPETGRKYVEGGCHTKSWFRLMGFKESDPAGIKSQYIFLFGNYLETMLTDLAKKGLVYENNSCKFWDAQNLVSGEVDLVLRHPDGGIIFTEIKSSSGDFKPRELGGGWTRGNAKTGKPAKYTKGAPSTQNLLQLVTYLWNFRHLPDLIGGKLVYIMRDKMTRFEFDVTIEDEQVGDIVKHRVYVNGEPDNRFFVEDLYDRYKTLQGLIKESFQLVKQGCAIADLPRPPREYELAYSDEKIEEEFEAERLSATKYNAFKKDRNARPGDWNCSYVTVAETIAI